MLPRKSLSPMVRRSRCGFYRPLLEPLENRTVPSFIAATAYPVDAGPQSVAAGDFNNDGFRDLAVANGLSGTLSVLLGKGDGSFQPPQNYAVGFGAQSVAVGDFNGDHVLDLAVLN